MVDPYRPAAQLVQLTALPVLYVPTAHTFVHVATVRPAVAPYLPATQGVHVPAVARLYVPAAHWAAVAVVDPATHAYPAVHDPVHVATVSPAVEP